MFRLSGWMLLAGLATAWPAQAQITIPASAVTLNFSNNNGCSIAAGQIYAVGTDQLVVSYNNTGSNWIAFSVRVVLSGTSFGRTIESAFTDSRPPGTGVVVIRGLTPALPGSITNGGATVTIQNCATAPDPSGPRRNWR